MTIRVQVGRSTIESDDTALRAAMAGAGRVIVDLGAGDAMATLRRARRSSKTLAVAVDADGSRMADSSRRAERERLSNAWFVVAAAEALPTPFDTAADGILVSFPWGSLLQGATRPETWFLDLLRRVARPQAEIAIALSVERHEVGTGLAVLDEAAVQALAGRYAGAGFIVERAGAIARADLDQIDSSWARRLGVGSRRRGQILRLRLP